MKLLGSVTSPYVRRTRMLMENIDYEFVHLNIFEESDREVLRKHSPILKIPVLVNGDEKIFDSRQIFRYLCEAGIHPRLDWEQENALSIIDGAGDSLISLYMLKRSNIDYPDDALVIKSNVERIELSLDWLDEAFARNYFNTWDYLTMSLYSLLAWGKFRNLVNLDNYKHFNDLIAKYADEPIVLDTKPK
jgi:glutathione S-transferase